jgi:hypothetical protein
MLTRKVSGQTEASVAMFPMTVPAVKTKVFISQPVSEREGIARYVYWRAKGLTTGARFPAIGWLFSLQSEGVFRLRNVTIVGFYYLLFT